MISGTVLPRFSLHSSMERRGKREGIEQIWRLMAKLAGCPGCLCHDYHHFLPHYKVFILHLQLKAFLYLGDLIEKCILNSWNYPNIDSGENSATYISSARFGSEDLEFLAELLFLMLESGMCTCTSGNGYLWQVDSHRETAIMDQRGVVIAIAPLAGLSPKIDNGHPTWLHIQIREFYPKFTKARGHQLKACCPAVDVRWTLGIPSERASENVLLLIHKEIWQKSSVDSILDCPLQDDYLANMLDSQDKRSLFQL